MSSKNNIVSIDSATSILNISLLKDDTIVTIEGENASSNNEELAVLLKQILNSNSLSINDVDTILINRGPGSFTGLRIGYAFLEGIISSIFSIKVAQVSLLEAVRYVFSNKVSNDDLICQHIRKGNYFIYNIGAESLEYVDSEFIASYLRNNNAKAFLINHIADIDKTFQYNFLTLTPSKVLLEYYTNFNVENINTITELKPNYIQKISAKKISER